VGHLTSDADEGEDKIEKAARKEKKSAQEIANYYFSIFRKDIRELNIEEPTIWCKATEHIKDQIEMIKILEKKGYTYRTSDGIYFDTSKLKDYGKLARLDIKGLQAGKRVKIGEKKNKTDFALWKFSKKPGVRQQEWDSPWGIGYPGWHIECSAMSSKYLGKQFDIHTGGIDHIPIHHTNEIAQSESAFGKKPWVRYWLHGNFLVNKEGSKVSKSTGGLYTLTELKEKGFEPMVYRYFCLGTHYRKKLVFSFENLQNAKNSYARLKNLINETKDDSKINEGYLKEFHKAINDDLNMPKALQVLWKLVRDKNAQGKIGTIRKMEEVTSLNLLKKEELKIPQEVKQLLEEREKARKQKNWKKADKIREKIYKLGYIVEDDKEGTKIKKR